MTRNRKLFGVSIGSVLADWDTREMGTDVVGYM